MRFKVNESSAIHRRNLGPSDYYRYFRYYFDFYCPPRPDLLPNLDENAHLYVPNKEIESQLQVFVDQRQSYPQLLTGLTGIGKSTSIRSFFDLWRESNYAREDRIVIPYFCNSMTTAHPPTKFFASGLRVVTDQLMSELEGGSLPIRPFWSYIDNLKPKALRLHRKFQFRSEEEDIQLLCEKEEFAYQALLMKFLLSQECHAHYKQVILILDDIEAIDDREVRRNYIRFAVHAFSCLVNRDGVYHVKLLVTERPYTRREFHILDWQAQKPDIQMRACASLKDVFQARHQYVVERMRPTEIQRGNWSKSYDILSRVVERVDDRGRELVQDLNNYNLRDAMYSVEAILRHGSWFQMKETRLSAFTIDDKASQLRVTRERILQALSYGEVNVYYERNSSEFGVTNILKNESTPEGDLVGPLILLWFVDELERDDLFSDRNFRSHETLVETVEELFPLVSGLGAQINRTVDRFLKHGILDEVVDPDNPSRVLYILMPRGLALWDELGSSSGLLEIYYDDLWLDRDTFRELASQSHTQKDKLKNCIKTCLELGRREGKLHLCLVTKELREKYVEAFGELIVVEHIARGIESSIKREYLTDVPEELVAERQRMRDCVRELKEALHE